MFHKYVRRRTMAKKKTKEEIAAEEEKLTEQIHQRYIESQKLLNSNLVNEHKKQDKKKTITYFVYLTIAIAFVITYTLLQYLLPDGSFKTIFFDTSSSNSWHWVAKIASSFNLLMVVEGIAYLIRLIISLASKDSSSKTITIVRLSSSAIKYIAAIIVLLGILSIWGVDTTTLVASAGVLALIIGLGAQTLIADIIAGVELVFEDQFEVGDMVVIDSFRGEVVEIGLSCVKIVDWAENVKVIRNNQITTVVNLSKFASVAITDVYLPHDADLDEVRKIIEKDFDTIQKENPNIVQRPIYLGVQEITPNYVNVRVFAKTPEADRFGTTRWMNEHFYQLMKKNGINVPAYQVDVKEAKGQTNI